MIFLPDENANPVPPSQSQDLAHPEKQPNSPQLVDLVVSESQFLEMKEKHDAEKETKINLKLVGKTVRILLLWCSDKVDRDVLFGQMLAFQILLCHAYLY